MSSFAKASFDVAGYLASRPSYPPRIIDILLKYHASTHSTHLPHAPAGRFDRAIDLGCGPGFLALSLAPHFRDVLALDPAEKMVKIGLQPGTGGLRGSRATTRSADEPGQGVGMGKGTNEIRYKVGEAERLGAAGVGEGEEGADLVIAGQAAHWFDHTATWKELSKRVRPGGTVAYLGYGELIFPDHPHLSPLVSRHSQFFWSGGHWQSGRAVVEGLLDYVPFPVNPASQSSASAKQARQELLGQLPPLEESLVPSGAHPISDDVDTAARGTTQEMEDLADMWDAGSAVRLKWDHTDDATAGSHSQSKDGGGGKQQWLMRKTFSRDSLEGYFRTWSALHAYHEANPDDAARKGKGEQGDIVDRLMAEIWAGKQKEDRASEVDRTEAAGARDGEAIEGAWPLVLMMIKRKA